MRRLLLIIGLLALLTASVLCTIYLVKQPRKALDSSTVSVGVEEPRQVLDPSELIAPPSPRKGKSVAPGAENESFSERSRPPGYMLAYPEWTAGKARVEGAKSVTDANQFIKPLWSPVGLDIAFTKSDFAGLYLGAPGQGSPPRLLAADVNIGKEFHWTPDGMSIRAPGADGAYAEFLITGERFPVPTPIQKVFVRDDRIFIRDEDGAEKQISGLEDRFTDPAISPDGLKVVYRGRETGLYIGLTDGSRVIYVGQGENARWLPDSHGIVFDRSLSDGTSIVDGDLWLATVDGRFLTNLTNTPGIVEAWPSVAPDGRRIAFTAGGAIYVGKLLRSKE